MIRATRIGGELDDTFRVTVSMGLGSTTVIVFFVIRLLQACFGAARARMTLITFRFVVKMGTCNGTDRVGRGLGFPSSTTVLLFHRFLKCIACSTARTLLKMGGRALRNRRSQRSSCLMSPDQEEARARRKGAYSAKEASMSPFTITRRYENMNSNSSDSVPSLKGHAKVG